MVLGFKDQFEEKILNESKIHTIREDKNNRWKEGNSIQFSTGVRTKNQNKFKDGVCYSVQKISIKWSKTKKGSVLVFIDGRGIGEAYKPQGGDGEKMRYDFQIENLAKNDGFDCVEDFFKWFDKDFKGNLIHWTEKMY